MLSEVVKKCETVEQLRRAVNLYFNKKNINDKYANFLRINLKKQNNFNKALIAVYNYILNQDFPMKQNDVGEVRYKGSAIGGMECHSYGHR